MKGNCLVLLSGGLDSAVSLAVAKKRMNVVMALTFDYGQRAARRELRAANEIARYFKVRHFILELPWLGEVSNSKLTSKKKVCIDSLTTVKDVWVPNRNGVFLSIGAAIAEAMQMKYVITGFNKEEGVEFRDNTKKFVDIFNKSLTFSTMVGVKVKSFVQDLTKEQIVKLGTKYAVPFRKIYSCYSGKEKMCGQCSSCRRFKGALKGAGIFGHFKKIFSQK